MNIEILKLGPLETNCYLLRKNDSVIVIDPADEVDKIIKAIGNSDLLGVIITHHHFDHIGALNELKEFYKVPIYDRNNMLEKEYNLDGFKFEVIYTPGHTKDSITIYFKDEKCMFTGDFIFKNSIGRTDLGGNILDMQESINKFKKYTDVIIYPGHGEKTTINYEKENNYYFK